MMKLNRNINKFTVIFLILLFSLNSCGIYRKTDVKTNPINDADKRAKNLAEGKGIQLLNSKKNSGVFDFASSNEMWRASIELLDFTPLSNVDYSGGIIITDWYSDKDNPKEAIKITLRFLSNEIQSNSIKVILHNKNCGPNEVCSVNEIDSNIKFELQKSILSKAAALEKETKESKK